MAICDETELVFHISPTTNENINTREAFLSFRYYQKYLWFSRCPWKALMSESIEHGDEAPLVLSNCVRRSTLRILFSARTIRRISSGISSLRSFLLAPVRSCKRDYRFATGSALSSSPTLLGFLLVQYSLCCSLILSFLLACLVWACSTFAVLQIMLPCCWCILFYLFRSCTGKDFQVELYW